MKHSVIFLFCFKSCEYVVLYITLVEVARKLSRFCKMAVGPTWLDHAASNGSRKTL